MTEETLSDRFVSAVQTRRYAMYHTALSYMKSPADAEDAVSEAIEVTWRHLGLIRNPDAMAAYLMRATINACKSHLRKKKKEIMVEDWSAYDTAEETGMPIWAYLDQLPEKYRIPLVMRYGDHIGEQEIARILRLNRGTVSSRLARGLALLREQMKQEERGEKEK